jgi:hypothetical protein
MKHRNRVGDCRDSFYASSTPTCSTSNVFSTFLSHNLSTPAGKYSSAKRRELQFRMLLDDSDPKVSLLIIQSVLVAQTTARTPVDPPPRGSGDESGCALLFPCVYRKCLRWKELSRYTYFRAWTVAAAHHHSYLQARLTSGRGSAWVARSQSERIRGASASLLRNSLASWDASCAAMVRCSGL